MNTYIKLLQEYGAWTWQVWNVEPGVLLCSGRENTMLEAADMAAAWMTGLSLTMEMEGLAA